MKVILLKSIKDLGQKGDVKEVKEGYGRNFLLARGLAVLATQGAVSSHRSELKNLAEHELKLEKDAEALKQKIETAPFLAHVSTNDQGIVFGSINTKDIVDLLKEKGIIVNKAQLEIKSPIKKIGESIVKINLYKNIKADLKIRVESF